VSRPEVRALYDRFRSRPFGRSLGATQGEWAQLQLGLKQVLRERLDEDRIQPLRARCAAEGLELLVIPLPAAPDADLDGVATSTWRHAHAYVGRDRAALEEAAALDGSMIPYQTAPTSRTLATTDDTRRLGELLGYPPCCTEAFTRWHEQLVDNHGPIAAAAEASERFDPLLNNVCLGAFRLIGWFPCRYDCPASLEIARRVKDKLNRLYPRRLPQATRVLSMPRVYMDERRQLILDGHVDGDRVHYRDVYSPYALDRQARTAAYEWVFYVDVVACVPNGDTLWLEGEELVVARQGRETHRTSCPNAVWLPFSSGASRTSASKIV